MPYSPDAEQAVLGSILKCPEIFDDVMDIVKIPEAFYMPKHQLIWKALSQLDASNTPIDSVMVGDQLEQMKKLDAAGGRSYLINLLDGVVTPSNVGIYAKIVAEKFKIRKVIKGCNKIADDASDPGADSRDLTNEIEQVALSISDINSGEFMTLGKVTVEYLAEIFSSDREKLKGEYIETRIPALNQKIIGIFKGDFTIISGPPSMGKTAFAVDLSIYNSILGGKILFICLDQGKRTMAQRFLTNATGLDRGRFYKNNLTDNEKDDLARAARKMSENENFQIYDGCGLSVIEIRSLTRRFKRRYGLDAVIIDYMQQIMPHRKFETRNLEVTEQCRMLRDLAKELNVAVIAISQLSRDYRNLPFRPEKKQFGFPSPSMLRDSGTIEQEATLILFVWNILQAMRARGISEQDPMYLNELEEVKGALERAFIVIGKQKDGPTGAVECYWDPIRMRFLEK